MKLVLTAHARFEAKRRQIDTNMIEKIAQEPQQTISTKEDMLILQGKYGDRTKEKKCFFDWLPKKKKEPER